MKYFAKLVPVEGDIKEGDTFLDLKEGTYHTCISKEHERIIQIFNSDSSNQNGKKVKLFLCSRDIQDGDTIKWCDKPLITEKNEVHLFGEYKVTKINKMLDKLHFIGDNGKNVSTPYPFFNRYGRIIGEISPEAIWVKEGDEFDEDQWDFEYYDESSDKTVPYGSHGKIEFECPTCKFFH